MILNKVDLVIAIFYLRLQTYARYYKYNLFVTKEKNQIVIMK